MLPAQAVEGLLAPEVVLSTLPGRGEALDFGLLLLHLWAAAAAVEDAVCWQGIDTLSGLRGVAPLSTRMVTMGLQLWGGGYVG